MSLREPPPEPPFWIDTHVHLDAPEFEVDRAAVRARARERGVGLCVLPSVAAFDFDTVRALAHETGDAYALGIHPICTPEARDEDLELLEQRLTAQAGDPRLVAMGEIGLDYFLPHLDADKQERFYRAQLRLARRHGLPLILHVRRSADRLLKGLREAGGRTGESHRFGGIAHAFNGSLQQAEAFLALGFKLGFGGAVTHERALHLRQLVVELPLSALVLETDAPDIQPAWLYVTAERREAGQSQGRNEPGELPRIARTIAELRGISLEELALAVRANAVAALPRLGGLMS